MDESHLNAWQLYSYLFQLFHNWSNEVKYSVGDESHVKIALVFDLWSLALNQLWSRCSTGCHGMPEMHIVLASAEFKFS